MTALPTHELELRAADQRRHLHSSVHELKDHVRDSLDVKKNVREQVLLDYGVAEVVADAVGCCDAGIFLSRLVFLNTLIYYGSVNVYDIYHHIHIYIRNA